MPNAQSLHPATSHVTARNVLQSRWRTPFHLSAQPRHRSHFGSRYKLGCCGHAGLFAPRIESTRAALYPKSKFCIHPKLKENVPIPNLGLEWTRFSIFSHSAFFFTLRASVLKAQRKSRKPMHTTAWQHQQRQNTHRRRAKAKAQSWSTALPADGHTASNAPDLF